MDGLTTLRHCPVPRCRFHRRTVYADLRQVKNHLRYGHDYKELQDASYSYGLIDSPDEKRGRQWFVDVLAENSTVLTHG